MKLGFIGAGNMASAILKGILGQDCLPAECLYISRKHPERSSEWVQQGVHMAQDNVSLVQNVDVVVLAIKPIYVAQVLSEIHAAIEGKFLISIVAGWTYDMLAEALPQSTRFVRVMPNTPLAVGEGMSVISNRYRCTEDLHGMVRGPRSKWS